MVSGTDGWELIFSGGDDICISVDAGAYRDDFIHQLMERFSTRTGGTISFGVGESIESAYINLRRAKARGPGVLVVTLTGQAPNELP